MQLHSSSSHKMVTSLILCQSWRRLPPVRVQPPVTQDDSYSDDLPRSFVPVAAPSMTEQEAVQQSVEQRQSSHAALMWPSIGGMPLNEFTTEGYFTCAFPTLFPTGGGDFLGQRQVPVTIGNYFKHLMQYDDGRFAWHPRFRFFALNTEMRHRALQAGRVYVRQHPGDGQLSLDELWDMVGRQGEAFSSRVLHYASSLRGTKQYWQRQRSRLLSMVDTLGLPTIFFTHSAADLQWPELAQLICPDNPDSRTAHTKAVIENPALADWFFYHRLMEFVKIFYLGVLGATDYWLRFEWQHRGSPHVHGLAWLPDTPAVEQLLKCPSDSLKEDIIRHADQLVCTTNPAVLPDGSNVGDAPAPKTDPHICNKAYEDFQDLDKDLADLVATCQRHTRCSAAYCLRTKHGKQECRFGYPKPLQPGTAIVTEEEPILITAQNDGMINSFKSSCLHGLLMWTCSILCHVSEFCSTAPSTSPRVSHGQSLSRRSSPPSSMASEKATSPSKQCRSCLSTPWERETTQLRRPATCCCSSPCSRHHVTSSSSALMGLVLLRTTWRKVSMPLYSPLLTTTWGDRTLHTLTVSLCSPVQSDPAHSTCTFFTSSSLLHRARCELAPSLFLTERWRETLLLEEWSLQVRKSYCNGTLYRGRIVQSLLTYFSEFRCAFLTYLCCS